MKIVVDARMYGPRRWTGIGRYLQNLIRELELLDHDNQYVILVGRENFDDYEPGVANFRKVMAPEPPYSLSEQVSLVWRIWRLRPDVVHYASPNAPLLYLGRHTTTIHDLTLLMFSTARGSSVQRWLREAKRLPFRFVVWSMAHSSRPVLTPTEYVRQQLRQRYGLGEQDVVVAANGVNFNSAEPVVVPTLENTRYVLYVGNCYPYKNVDLLVEAFSQIAVERTGLRLVIVGRDDYFRSLLRRRVTEMKLDSRVSFTGAVSDGELRWIYQHAALYVNPSLSEGFGLQGLEAMATGVPVLAARASCLPEVYGDAADYFDPTSRDELVAGMNALLDEQLRRVQLQKRGYERIKQFSWTDMAKKTLDAYRQAAS